MFLTDTHVHLHFPDYDEDRDLVLRRAREAGIRLFINVGTDLKTSRQALDLASQHEDIYATAGLHPHDAKEAGPGMMEAMAALLEHPRMVAIGEVGLDFFRDHSPRGVQESVLRAFLALHFKTGKPLIIHCRDAAEELSALLKEDSGGRLYSGVMHCFSSGRKVMEDFLGLGFYISFAGPLTYKKNDALREACRECPPERLLLETDAPFLPPQSMRGKRNESAYLAETARTAASLHGISLEELAARTTENAKRLFRL